MQQSAGQYSTRAGDSFGTGSPYAPEEKPPTDEKIELGRRLFTTAALTRSLDRVRVLPRSGPCLHGRPPGRHRRPRETLTPQRTVPLSLGYGHAFFWDGRASTLEEQVLQPVQDPNEWA